MTVYDMEGRELDVVTGDADVLVMSGLNGSKATVSLRLSLPNASALAEKLTSAVARINGRDAADRRAARSRRRLK